MQCAAAQAAQKIGLSSLPCVTQCAAAQAAQKCQKASAARLASCAAAQAAQKCCWWRSTTTAACAAAQAAQKSATGGIRGHVRCAAAQAAQKNLKELGLHESECTAAQAAQKPGQWRLVMARWNIVTKATQYSEVAVDNRLMSQAMMSEPLSNSVAMEAEAPLGEQVTITDTSHIAKVIESLDGDIYTLSLRVRGEATYFPVTLGDVDRQSRHVELTLLDAQSLSAEALMAEGVSLRAEGVAETLTFEDSDAVKVERDGDCLSMTCRLPRSLRTRSKRRDVRVPLIKGMSARVAIDLLPGQPAVIARLLNLSARGCQLEFPLNQSAPFIPGLDIPELTITFPNGDVITLSGQIRHVTPAGRSNLVVAGVAFERLSNEQAQRVVHAVNETEQEVVYRTRKPGQMAWPSPLYRSDRGIHSSVPRRCPQHQHSAPMVATLKDVARQLHLTLLKLQQRRPLPTAILYLCADRMLDLLSQHRQNFLYALHCLGDEPAWVQHSVGVAGRLADMLVAEPALQEETRDAVVGALLHDMGKAMLLSRSLPSLEGTLSESQKAQLRGHVKVLQERLLAVGWRGRPGSQIVIASINERLDGSGYPEALTAQCLSSLSRIAAVVDVIDAITRQRGDRRPLTTVEAYRHLYGLPGRFDKQWVTRYIQRHGFYPIGSLVRFSRGYLAWVMQLDETGQPERVRVVMNVSGGHTPLDEVVSKVDFHQLGKPDGLVRPEPYRLTPF